MATNQQINQGLRAAALGMAARMAKLAELEAEVNERGPKITALAQKVEKLQSEITDLR